MNSLSALSTDAIKLLDKHSLLSPLIKAEFIEENQQNPENYKILCTWKINETPKTAKFSALGYP